jgi:isoquinoline 1-oxidoreductase
VGSGIVVCLLVSDDAEHNATVVAAAAEGRQKSGWLHIAESGEVTVYTGKVEVGQNIRTS